MTGLSSSGASRSESSPRHKRRLCARWQVKCSLAGDRSRTSMASSPFGNASSALTNARRGQGVPAADQFHLHAHVAISGRSARHLGTSLDSKLARIKFTLVLSLPIFLLPVYPFSSQVGRLRRMLSLRFYGVPTETSASGTSTEFFRNGAGLPPASGHKKRGGSFGNPNDG